MSLKINSGQIQSANSNQQTKKRIADSSKRAAFESMFQEKLEEKKSVKVSSHAQQRLSQRNIQLDQQDFEVINEAIQNADAKGSKELLLLYKNTAFITNVPNNTIITAVDTKETTDNVFTNIDSAVIINK